MHSSCLLFLSAVYKTQEKNRSGKAGYLFRLQPWVAVVKRSCGWHKAKRSGIHDQISFISFALTISEEKVSGLRASWTFRLETAQ